jgi:hypothetical protein
METQLTPARSPRSWERHARSSWRLNFCFELNRAELARECVSRNPDKEWLDHAAHIAHGTDTAVEIAEVASLIAEGTAAATALQLMAAVLTPIMIGIAILNAADTDKRLAGMQARSATR